MQKNNSTLTIFFKDPFWVGVFENENNGKLEVCQVIFGSLPKNEEIYEFILQHYLSLPFTNALNIGSSSSSNYSYKRMQRVIKKQLTPKGTSTKSQQALKLQQEENKSIRKINRKNQKQVKQQMQFSLNQKKRKEKRKTK